MLICYKICFKYQKNVTYADGDQRPEIENK